MTLLGTLVVIAAGAVAFRRYVTFEQFLPNVQAIVTVLSIMMAAVFVRLNRGMPTLDWKSVELSQRLALTRKIEDVTFEYVVICGCLGLALIGLLGLQVAGQPALQALHEGIARNILTASGGLLALCGARMAYVVWRDYDIVRLQRKIIDAAGQAEQKDKERALADQRLEAMRSSSNKAIKEPG